MPTSSPRTKTRSSFSISSQMPSLIASTYVVSAMLALRSFVVDVSSHFFGCGIGLCFGPVDRVIHDLHALHLHFIAALLGEHTFFDQLLLEARDRILALPFFEKLGRHITGVVVRGVAGHAEGLELHQRRSSAGTGEVDRALGGVVHGEDVVAVDPVSYTHLTLPTSD